MKTTKFIAVFMLFASISIINSFGQEPNTNKKSKTETKISYVCSMHPDIKGKNGDKCSKCGMALSEKKKQIYTCTMHPDVMSNKLGKCSKCGMDLIEKKTKM